MKIPFIHRLRGFIAWPNPLEAFGPLLADPLSLATAQLGAGKKARRAAAEAEKQAKKDAAAREKQLASLQKTLLESVPEPPPPPEAPAPAPEQGAKEIAAAESDVEKRFRRRRGLASSIRAGERGSGGTLLGASNLLGG